MRKPIEFTPISKYIWVFKEEVKKVEEKTASGLITKIGESTVLQETGVVAGIGILADEKVQKVIRVGDTILFEGAIQKGKKVGNQEFLLVIDSSVMAKL